MTVRQTNSLMPDRVIETDINKVDDIPTTTKGLQEELTRQSLHRQLAQERKLTEDITSPPQYEPPVKIAGSINLGEFNLQEQQRHATEIAERSRVEAEQRIDKVREELDKTKNALQDSRLESVRNTLESQIAVLAKAVQDGHSTQPSFENQLAMVETFADKLGFVRPEAGSSDLNTQLAIKKLDADMKREDRRFQLEMKKDERLWQLKLKEIEMQQHETNARINAERERNQMFAQFPEHLGSAIAKGMMARGDNGNGQLQQPISDDVMARMTGKPTAHHRTVEANIGDYGQFDCDQCGTSVGMGPDSEITACAGCGTIFDVVRIPTKY